MTRHLFSAALGAALIVTAAARAQDRIEPLPKAFEDVQVEERLDETIPLDLAFRDENGKAVTLGDYFDGKRPVLLTLNYYKCPMLCTLQLNGLIDGLKDLTWTPGKEFEIVTISFDPAETPNLARIKKQNYMRYFERPAAGSGWHFLTGSKESIQAISDAVGFSFKWDPVQEMWVHEAAIFLITPDGRISRYLYGVMYPVKDLRLGLLEASEGKIGTTLDRLFMTCYQYDSKAEGYVLKAQLLMRLGGVTGMMLLGLLLLALWTRELRRRHPIPQESGT